VVTAAKMAMPNAMDSAAKMKRGAITRSNTLVGNTITSCVSLGVNKLSFAREPLTQPGRVMWDGRGWEELEIGIARVLSAGASFRVKQQGGEGAKQTLDEARSLITDRTDFYIRFLVCEALAAADRHAEVVDLLEDKISTRFDSPALRMLAGAAANADRRALLARIFKEIPPEVSRLPYYRRVKIAQAFSIGDIRSAERQVREYLGLEPTNLAMHVQLLEALFRQNKEAELKVAAARPSSDFSGTPESFMHFAQFKKDFGDPKEALDLAYRTVLANQRNETVNLGYVGMFLLEWRRSSIDLSPATVSDNMAVGLKRDDGLTSTYVIEPEAGQRSDLSTRTRSLSL
jgi:hypothetical protein